MNAPEVRFLVVKIRCNVMAEQRKEGGNRKGFIAVGYGLEVDRMPIEPERKEGCGRVYGYHEENADDTTEGSVAKKGGAGQNILSLLPRLGVM